MNNDWREYYDPQYVLMHHGIKGQKWGVRRFENENGTLTAEGKKRYGDGKVEKHLMKSKAAENKAINAKTNFGRNIYAQKAYNERRKAEIAGEKTTGNRKLLAVNKNSARDYGAVAETSANIAAGLKKKAESQEGKKREKTMNKAVTWLASANNSEKMATAYKAAANAPIMTKYAAYTKSMLSGKGKMYTNSGRTTTTKSRTVEVLADVALSGIPTIAAEMSYKKKNTAEERYNKLATGKKS